MAKSQRLTLRHVRDTFRLVGECRDLGQVAHDWILHAARGLQKLLNARVVTMALADRPGFQRHQDLLEFTQIGWESPVHAEVARTYFSENRHLQDPSFQRYREIARPNITLRPVELISRDAFRASEEFQWRKAAGIEDFLFSQRQGPRKRNTLVISPQRGYGEAYFTLHEERLLKLFHTEMARLLGTVLRDGYDPTAGLSPRLRETLEALLAGESEKTAARRLGVSRHTVHDYVMGLYKHFGVHSRAELLSLCLRKSHTPDGRQDNTP